MKNRQQKKILKIVARQINSGDFTKLKPVHFRCVDKTFDDYIYKKYITEFRPWWYDQIDNWSNMNLGESMGSTTIKLSQSYKFGQVLTWNNTASTLNSITQTSQSTNVENVGSENKRNNRSGS